MDRRIVRNNLRQMLARYAALRARLDEQRDRLAPIDRQEEALRNPSCVAGWSETPKGHSVGRPTEQTVERLQKLDEQRRELGELDALAVEFVRQVDNLLGGLRDESYYLAEAIEMRYIDGLTLAEATNAYNARRPRADPITEDAMKKRVQAAMDRLEQITNDHVSTCYYPKVPVFPLVSP